MKPESERPTIVKFKSGESVSGLELHADSQDYFLDVVWPMALEEKVTGQRSLGLGEPQDIYYKLVNPVVEEPVSSLEADHLCRPVQLHRGISQKIVTGFDESLEDMKLSKVREVLDRLTLFASRHPELWNR